MCESMSSISLHLSVLFLLKFQNVHNHIIKCNDNCISAQCYATVPRKPDGKSVRKMDSGRCFLLDFTTVGPPSRPLHSFIPFSSA